MNTAFNWKHRTGSAGDWRPKVLRRQAFHVQFINYAGLLFTVNVSKIWKVSEICDGVISSLIEL